MAAAGGTVVLGADAAHFYEEYRRDMPFHVYSDLQGMQRGFESLRGVEDEADTVVVPGHDPDVMRHFPQFSPDTTGLAVRLG